MGTLFQVIDFLVDNFYTDVISNFWQTHGFMRNRKSWKRKSFSLACVIALGAENDIEFESMIFTTDIWNLEGSIESQPLSNVTRMSSDPTNRRSLDRLAVPSSPIVTPCTSPVTLLSPSFLYPSSGEGGIGNAPPLRDISFHLNQIKCLLSQVENLLYSQRETNFPSSSTIDDECKEYTFGWDGNEDTSSSSTQQKVSSRIKSPSPSGWKTVGKNMLNKLKFDRSSERDNDKKVMLGSCLSWFRFSWWLNQGSFCIARNWLSFLPLHYRFTHP